MKDTILIDIDHTVSDAAWRDGLINERDWDNYHSQSKHDRPASDVVDFVKQLSLSYNVYGLTSRPEKWRQLTCGWCVEHQVSLEYILMRPNDCYLPSPECKLRIVEREFGPDWRDKVLMVLDDRDDVTQAFNREGITTLQVKGRQYDR